MHVAVDAAARCNLTGLWHCDGVDGRIATDAALSAANVTAVAPPPGWLWSAGEGVLGSDGVTLFMEYNTSAAGLLNRTGKVAPDCSSIAWNDQSTWQCVYESAGQVTGSCPQPPSVLDVHIVCHTHDDTGYLSTVDECVPASRRVKSPAT